MSSNARSGMSWPPDPWNPFLIQIGRIVMHFNTLEHAMHAILTKMATDWNNPALRAKHWAITAHIQNKTLTDAMRTIAHESVDLGEIEQSTKDLICHCVDTFDLTREYRNWYVHGFNGIGTANHQPVIQLQSFSARKNLLEHADFLTLEGVEWFADWCHDAHHHVATAHHFIAFQLGYKISGGPPPPLPDIWPLPKRLTKPSHRRLARQLQRPPSQE